MAPFEGNKALGKRVIEIDLLKLTTPNVADSMQRKRSDSTASKLRRRSPTRTVRRNRKTLGVEQATGSASSRRELWPVSRSRPTLAPTSSPTKNSEEVSVSTTREKRDHAEPGLTSRMSSIGGEGDMGGFDQIYFDEVSEQITTEEKIH
jgi:hypothetical protein